MKEHKFKIGDTVVLTGPFPLYVGKLLTIKKLHGHNMHGEPCYGMSNGETLWEGYMRLATPLDKLL